MPLPTEKEILSLMPLFLQGCRGLEDREVTRLTEQLRFVRSIDDTNVVVEGDPGCVSCTESGLIIPTSAFMDPEKLRLNAETVTKERQEIRNNRANISCESIHALISNERDGRERHATIREVKEVIGIAALTNFSKKTKKEQVANLWKLCHLIDEVPEDTRKTLATKVIQEAETLLRSEDEMIEKVVLDGLCMAALVTSTTEDYSQTIFLTYLKRHEKALRTYYSSPMKMILCII